MKEKNSYLNERLVYLSGPIEMDTGPNWRPVRIKELYDKFGLNIFDPFSDEKQHQAPSLKEALANEDYDKVAAIAKNFVRKDLTKVDHCDILIARVDRNIPTTGTVEEIVSAWRNHKVVLLVCERGKKFIPAWFFGYIPHKYMFGSWGELYNYLQEVEDEKHKDDFRWAYIYGLI